MDKLLFDILTGIYWYISPPLPGTQLTCSCVGLDYSHQLRSQWLSVESLMESVLIDLNPPTAIIWPAIDDFTYPPLIDDNIMNTSTSVEQDFLRSIPFKNTCS